MPMYKTLSCYFSFSFINRNLRMGITREAESRKQLSLHTQGRTVRFFSETSLLFPLHLLLSRDWYRATLQHPIILLFPRLSTFASGVQSHLKASNYLSFPSLLYFRESGIISGPSTPPALGQSGASDVCCCCLPVSFVPAHAC